MNQWNALVRLCAYMSAAVAIARGVSVGDRESIAVGVAMLLAEIATHLPWRLVSRLGWIGLTLLFVNQGFWMVTAVVALTSSAPSTLGAIPPAILSVTAVVGFLASMARLQSRLQSAVGPLLGVGAVTMVALAVGVPIAGAGAVDAQQDDVRVTTTDVAFEPDEIDAAAGDIGIIVKNDDLFWHTLTITDLDANVTVATGGRKRLQLRDVGPGRYEFVCAIPGHEQAGMTGTLIVS